MTERIIFIFRGLTERGDGTPAGRVWLSGFTEETADGADVAPLRTRPECQVIAQDRGAVASFQYQIHQGGPLHSCAGLL